MNRFPSIFIFSVFLIFTTLILTIAWPYKDAIFFSLILTGIFLQPYRLLQSKFKLSSSQASILICILITLFLFIPFIYIIYKVSSELLRFSSHMNPEIVASFLRGFYNENNMVMNNVRNIMNSLDIAKNEQGFIDFIVQSIKEISGSGLERLNSWLSNILLFLINYCIMILCIYSLLAYNEKIKTFLIKIIPIPEKIVQVSFEKFTQMNFVILVGSGLTGIIQGTLAGTIFGFLGIEAVLLWAVIMVVLSFIPLIGMSLIYIPTGIYFFFNDELLKSLIVLISCGAISFVTENIFKPKFIGKRVKINSLLMLLSIIGGLTFFGPTGIFYGPIIITMFLTFVQLMDEDIQAKYLEKTINHTPAKKKLPEESQTLEE